MWLCCDFLACVDKVLDKIHLLCDKSFLMLLDVV